jgi:hypothetical protein
VEDQRLCCECIGEAFLQAKVQKEGDDEVCFYCGRTAKTFSIGEMADEIETAFKEHYYRTPTEPSDYEYAMMKEGLRIWEREGDPVAHVISWCAEIDPQVAEDIRAVLEDRNLDEESEEMGEEGPFDSDAHYAQAAVNDVESQAGWRYFEDIVKTQARYFSRTAEAILASTFQGMAEHKTHKGKPVVVVAGPGKEISSLYRARVFQSKAKLEEALKRPDTELGPPPAMAAAAGRMNAHGISVFYGAVDPSTALAEVRPPVGSRVLVGRFELLRSVQLIDVEALGSVNVDGSVFDRDFIQRLERAKFLKWLSHRISMPVMPDDESFDYLPTQVIADFLASKANPPLDGIIYPSIQSGENKPNVALFHEAALVQLLDIPRGTEISATLCRDTEDGPETDYWVSEEVPPRAPAPAAQEAQHVQFFPLPLDPSGGEGYEPRIPALKVDISSLQVHHVSSVDIHAESHSVARHRFEKRELPF